MLRATAAYEKFWPLMVSSALCRLLRNRVSAQQAREKKKLLLAQLEARVADLESRNASLDEEAAALVQVRFLYGSDLFIVTGSEPLLQSRGAWVMVIAEGMLCEILILVSIRRWGCLQEARLRLSKVTTPLV